MTDAEIVRSVCDDTARLHREVGDTRADAIVAAATLVAGAVGAGRRVLVFGNGGSAADAQHFAAELVGQFSRTVSRPAWPVLALVSDPATTLAVANDFGFEAVFARQIEAFGTTGDVAVAITTSGTSANVNAGLRRAR